MPGLDSPAKSPAPLANAGPEASMPASISRIPFRIQSPGCADLPAMRASSGVDRVMARSARNSETSEQAVTA
jgi:hypothetical protein